MAEYVSVPVDVTTCVVKVELFLDFFQQVFLVYEVWKGARMAYSGRIVVHPHLPIPENRRICHE